MPFSAARPLAVYYEHPDWFRPLFMELDRRGVPHARLHADAHVYDPSNGPPAWGLLFNRMSPSADRRGRGDAIFYTLQYLDYLERAGMRVVNGRDAFLTEISKARQLALLRQLGLPFPAARVIHRAGEAVTATEGLRFPVVIKPNVGGSGAGVRKFDAPESLAAAAAAGDIDLGLDRTALVQEYVPHPDGMITRVEVLGGKYLYAIHVYAPEDDFNLCPADACRTTDGAELARAACPVDAPQNGLRVERATPPADVIDDVERIMAAAGIEVGGVEYVIDARDGKRYYYDINALSNFVADAPRVVGMDPFARLVDWLVAEAR
jgi:hypothetical protein